MLKKLETRKEESLKALVSDHEKAVRAYKAEMEQAETEMKNAEAEMEKAAIAKKRFEEESVARTALHDAIQSGVLNDLVSAMEETLRIPDFIPTEFNEAQKKLTEIQVMSLFRWNR